MSRDQRYWGKSFALLLVLVLTTAGCLRLVPSERPDTDSQKSSTDSGSKSSDTENKDTSAPTHPCDGVTCLARPDWRSCAKGKLTIVSSEGYCALDSDSEAQCRFNTEHVECPSGKCADAKYCSGSPCHGVRCDTPPPNSHGADTGDGSTDEHQNELIVHEREGRCQNGDTDSAPTCVYDVAQIIDCQNGGLDTDSEGGTHCAEEPCLGVVCNRPPARYCEDANTLVVWNLYGRCADDGACVYDKRTVTCPEKGGCQNGRCASEPCAGMLCYRPLARYCASKETVVQFHHAGTCDASGGCVYREERLDCPDSNCAGGNCGSQVCFDGPPPSDVGFLDRTSCYSPPASYCNRKGELVFWNAMNPCDDEGHCTYINNDPIACDPGSCRDGRCTKDPCAGEQWSCHAGRPAEYCADDTRVYSALTDCTSNEPCGYKTVTEPCPGSCRDGVCVEDSPAAPPRGTGR